MSGVGIDRHLLPSKRGGECINAKHRNSSPSETRSTSDGQFVETYSVSETCLGVCRMPRIFSRYLIRQAAEGLSYLHARGIALQDVSLENLLLFVKEVFGILRNRMAE